MTATQDYPVFSGCRNLIPYSEASFVRARREAHDNCRRIINGLHDNGAGPWTIAVYEAHRAALQTVSDPLAIYRCLVTQLRGSGMPDDEIRLYEIIPAEAFFEPTTNEVLL